MCRVLMMPELSTQRPSTTKNWPSLDNQHPTIRTWLILILKQPSESFRVCIFFALALILFLKSYESRGTKVFRSKQKSPPNKKNHLLPLCYENKTKQKKGKNRKMPETHGKAHCSCLLLLFVWRRRRVRLLGAVINDLLPGQPKVVGRVDVQALSFTHFYITNPAKRQRIRNIYHKITGANTY